MRWLYRREGKDEMLEGKDEDEMREGKDEMVI